MKKLRPFFSFATALFLAVGLSTPASAEAEPQPIPVAECQLPSGPREFTNFGFPRSSNRLPSEGTVRAQILFVDFPDAVGTDEKQLRKVARLYTAKFKKFYSAQSYGRLTFEFSFVPKYFRIDSKTSSYNMNLRKGQNGEGTLQYFQDAIRAADKEVDFTGIDVVYVIPSNTNREITYGPAFPMGIGSSLLQTDEGAIQNGAVAGTDSRLRENSLEWVWLAHETGHLFGLEHPWKVDADSQGRGLSAPSFPVWDLMLNMGDGVTGDFLGWSRFLIGWLQEKNVICLDAQSIGSESITASIAALSDRSNNEKFLFVKTGAYTGIAVEVRTRGGLNRFPRSWEGLLIYEIDTRKIGNEGAAALVGPVRTRQNGLEIGTLRLGQTVKSSGISIKYSQKTKKRFEITLGR
jgi:M6 family metalloprotease-like protein